MKIKTICGLSILLITVTLLVACLSAPPSPRWTVKNVLDNVEDMFVVEEHILMEEGDIEYDWFNLVMENYHYKIVSCEVVGRDAFVEVVITNKDLKQVVLDGTFGYIQEALTAALTGKEFTEKELNEIYTKNLNNAVAEVNTLKFNYIFTLQMNDNKEWIITNNSNKTLLNAVTGNIILGFDELNNIMGGE